MISLQQRLSRGLVLSLLAIFILHWFAADWAIRMVAEKEMMTRLAHDSDTLLATITNQNGAVNFDYSRLPLVYGQAFSGHYFVMQINGRSYSSTSLQQLTLPVDTIDANTVKRYYLQGPQAQPLLALGRGFEQWGAAITLTVAEDLTAIGQDILAIRLVYLAITVVIFAFALMLQSLDVKRAMLPLGNVVTELEHIANGKQTQILTDVPQEISPLVNEVNRLIILIKQRLQRSRTAIGNLAHALKTPLAVMVRISEHPNIQAHTELIQLLESQTQTIHNRIQRELKRARLAGNVSSGTALNPYQELTTLAHLLNSIYAEKNLLIAIDAPDGLVPFDREDFLEIVGNLADNACKWGRHWVDINVTCQQQLIITVEDDGPGCPESEREQLAQRGVRFDENIQGHGLGLAIVRDVAELYGGQMQLGRSEKLGGLLVTITV